MSGEVFHVGVDHHLAPLEIREQVALGHDGAAEAARAMRDEGWASEVAIVTTCNRTELYVTTAEQDGADLALGAWLRHVPGAPSPESGYYRRHSAAAAAQHLVRVACGLESAILGETEIQGQVRAAHERGHASGTVGPLLDRLFQTAARAGKRARTETGISEGGVSHGSAAAQVVRRIFDTLEDRQLLVVGAGQIAAQAARALAELGEGSIVVANRTRAHAEALAAELPRSSVRGLEDLIDTLRASHVAIFATSAEPLSAAAVAQALKRRRDPLLLVDLGLPRCVEAAAANLPGVFLYDLDALEELVAGALAVRREAVPAVEAIIHEELSSYRAWLRGRGAMPAIRTLNQWAETIRTTELGYLPEQLSPEVLAAVDKMSRRLVQRLLGRAAARVVKGAGGEDPKLPTAADLKSVFGLDEGETP